MAVFFSSQLLLELFELRHLFYLHGVYIFIKSNYCGKQLLPFLLYRIVRNFEYFITVLYTEMSIYQTSTYFPSLVNSFLPPFRQVLNHSVEKFFLIKKLYHGIFNSGN